MSQDSRQLSNRSWNKFLDLTGAEGLDAAWWGVVMRRVLDPPRQRKRENRSRQVLVQGKEGGHVFPRKKLLGVYI